MIQVKSVKVDMKKLEEIGRRARKTPRRLMQALAFQMEVEAKKNAPVRTGALRNSIFTENLEDGPVAAVVGPSMEYGIFVELGTSRMAARPYLVPAVELLAGEAKKAEFWNKLFKV